MKWAHPAFGTRVSYPLLGPTLSEDLGQEPGCPASVSPSGKELGCCQEHRRYYQWWLWDSTSGGAAPQPRMTSAASSSPPLPRTLLSLRGARGGPAGQDRASGCQTSLHGARDVAAPGTGEATEAPCWPGPCLTAPASASLSAEWGLSHPPGQKPMGGLQCGQHGDLLSSADSASLAAQLCLCPALDVGGHGHFCPQVPDPAHRSSHPKPRAIRGHQPGLHRWGHPRDAWHHSALGKGASIVTATSKYRPPRPLVTPHCTWASLAAAGPARSGGGVVSGLARGLQVQSRAQARVSGSLLA